jgi:uncharacterized membrane protein required for colicin V production
LDLLIAFILVVFIPIGAWRGLTRELIALAGIILAALVVSEWAAPWGDDLAISAGLRPQIATFWVAILLFWAIILLVSYGSALLLTSAVPSRWQRLLGGLIGFVNAALVISYTLRFLQVYLLSDQPDTVILQSPAGWFLVRLVGFVYLLPVIVLAPAVLAAAGVAAGAWWRGASPVPEPSPRAAAPPVERPAWQQGTVAPDAGATMRLALTPAARGTSPASDGNGIAPDPAATTTVLPRIDEPLAARRCPDCGEPVAASAGVCRGCGRAIQSMTLAEPE